MPKITFLGAMEVIQNFVHGVTNRQIDRLTKQSIEAPSRRLQIFTHQNAGKQQNMLTFDK